MQIETRQTESTLIVTPLDHRIDAYLAAAFRTALIDRIDAGARYITIDLHKVDFMDSYALGALVSALKRIGPHGPLRVCSLRPAVRSMFELTRLNQLIPILDTEHEGSGTLVA
jgi:anti-sigma B factor antagonist